MADHTVPGIIGIVAIVLVVAVFISGAQEAPNFTPVSESTDVTNALGGAVTTGGNADIGRSCEPDAFCDGSRLTFVREDCSMNYAFCQYGCSEARCI